MSVRTETLQLRVLIDGTPARRELATLDQEYAKINAGLKDLKKGSDEATAALKRMGEIKGRQAELRQEIGLTSLTAKQLGDELRKLQVAQRNATPNTKMWAENAARIEEVKARLKELNDVNARAAAAWEVQRQQIRLTDMTMEQLEQEAGRLRTALRTMDPNTAEFRNLNRELLRVDDRMGQLRNNLTPLQALWRNLKQEMSGVLGVTAGLFAGGMVLGKMRDWVRASAELSDAQADVRKTTNLTQVEVEELTRQLGQLNTRTARSELLELAREAGKLGRSKEELLGFARAGDQINVALGEDLGDDAIRTIGKLTEQFKITSREGYDLERSMLAIGSGINELGMASTASEGFIVDFTSRMAGVNTQANVSIESTMGFAAALDQLGQRSETSSTAMAQFTIKAFTKTAEYANIAGMEVAEFTALLKSDTNEALLRTLEGLNGNNEGLSRMTSLFSDLGQEGARAVGVLASMASNTKMVREQQAIATKAMADATSVTAEFATKNNTLAADLDIIGKRLAAAFVNSGVVTGIKSMVSGLRDLVEVPVSETLEQERFEMMKLHAQILSTNEGTDGRVKLIKELQARYPGYLGNLDAEKVSNQQLSIAVADLNKQLVNKIILQQKDEEIKKQIERQAEKQMAVLEQEDLVRGRLVKLAEEYNLQIKQGVPLIEQSKDLSQQIEEIRKRTFNTGGGIVFDQVARFRKSISELDATYGALNSEQNVSNRLVEERTALLQRLGIEEKKVVEAASGEPTTAPTLGDTSEAGEPDEKALDKARAELEALRAELEKGRRQIELDALSADERELAQLDAHYAQLRAQFQANERTTAADLLALDELHAQARAEKLAEQGQKRIDDAANIAQQALKAEQDAQDSVFLGELEGEDLEITQAMQRMDAMVALYEKAGVDTKNIVANTEAAIAAIRKKYRTKEEQDAATARNQRIQEQIAIYQGVNTALAGVNGLLAAAYAASGNANYQNTVGAKALGLAQIAIASGVGVAEAIKAGAGIPFPANLGAIATGVGAVLTGIANAINLLNSANITKPSFGGEGGGAQPGLNAVPLGEKGGIFSGPSHADGGLKVVDPQRGRVVAEVEGGEPWMVLSKAFRHNNPGLVPMLLHASATGARLPLGARGGIFSPVPAFNFVRATEVLAPSLATGGLVAAGNATAARAGATGDGDAEEMRNLLRTLVAINQKQLQAQQDMPTTLQARVSFQDIERRNTEMQEVRRANKVARG
jgi:hypothetical protein